ncbi:hypothetical protein MMC18_007416 [Xylographa bjoerkii]|nr:hypothetical protein [Xylographa bjoerkii]
MSQLFPHTAPISREFSTYPILVPHTPLKELEPLLGDYGGKWTLSKDGKGLERHLKFKTFKRTRTFIEAVCQKAADSRHHPEWANVYNRAFIRLTTHKDKESGESGISAKDLDFARFCDDAVGEDDISADVAEDASWGHALTSQMSEAAQIPEMATPSDEKKKDTLDTLETSRQ